MDRVVQSFTIGRLIIISLIARLFALFLLPPTPSFLAPDEGTYAFLASWVAGSQNVEEFPGYGAGLYNTSKTLIVPASVLVRLGLDELAAARIVSIFFGLLSIYFFTKIIFFVLNIKNLQDIDSSLLQRLMLAVIMFFAFIPSHFIWSNLGLRESPSDAMLLASVFYLLRLREIELSRSNVPKNLMAISLPILTLTLSFGARKQTAFVFVVFFCLSILVMSRRRNFLRLTGVILLGTVLGLIFSTTPTISSSNQFAWFPVEQADVKTNETKSLGPVATRTDGTIAICDKEREGDRISTNSSELLCTSNEIVIKREISVSEVANQTPIQTLDEFEYKREVNRIDAQTALRATSCTNYSQLTIQNVICNAKEFPYRITTFLTRPLPIIDSGTLLNNLASAENLIWILMLISFAYSLIISIRKRFRLEIVVPTSLFIVFFSSLAALYEGNMGTAFRHKSTILWGLLLVIVICIDCNWRKSEEERKKEDPRYAS